MRTFRRWVAAILLIAGVVGIALLSPDDLNFGVKVKRSKKKKKKAADQVMNGVHLIETSEGKNEWELWAAEALSFKGKGTWSVRKVKVIFYSDNGLQFVTTGDRGSIKVNSKDMHISGNVVTRTSNDYRFYSDAVVYNSKRRELNTAHPVRILGPRDKRNKRMELKGVGLIAEMTNSRFYLNSQVQGKHRLDGKELKIKSKEAQMSAISKEAIFTGDVEMEMDTLTVTGPRAKFKYGDNESLLDSIEVTGGVRVSDKNKWATSKSLDILVPKDMYVLNGSPRVVHNNDEIRGEQIVLLNGGKQVQVKRGKGSLHDRGAGKEL